MPSDRSRVSSESPARLAVRLLGAVEVILDGRRLGAFNNLRLQRFLALITLRRDLQHRSRLAFELWPDSNERQVRTNLRKLLHDFRHSLPDIGEFVEIDNEIVRWIPTGPSEVDVLRFREAIAVGDLELAARLYSGDLLPVCYDDWVLDERAKLRAEAYGAFVRLPDESHRTNGTMTILAGTLMCCSTATKPCASAPSMSCGGRASATWFPDVPTNPRTMASITSGTYGSATRRSIPPRSASPPHSPGSKVWYPTNRK